MVEKFRMLRQIELAVGEIDPQVAEFLGKRGALDKLPQLIQLLTDYNTTMATLNNEEREQYNDYGYHNVDPRFKEEDWDS